MDENLPDSPDPVLDPPHLQDSGRAFSQVLVSLAIVLIGLTVGTFVWAATTSTDEAGVLAADAQIGDHWHAAYAVYIGDELQPNMPTWESGVHTHGDGIIHIHPFQHFEEGSGAALTKFFAYGGGTLTEDEFRIPGQSRTYLDGDSTPDGDGPGHVYIAATAAEDGEKLQDFGNGWALVSPDYVPRDGDRILFFFSTEDQMAFHMFSPNQVPNPGGTSTPLPTLTPHPTSET
jgi:hypothetical protein